MLKKFMKSYWKTLAFFALTGVVGGFLSGLYLLDTYPVEVQQKLQQQGIDSVWLGVITAAQSLGYGVILGALGIVLAKKVGLWREELRFEKDPESMDRKELEKLIAEVQKKMQKAAADLNFEAAAELRDKMLELKTKLNELKEDKG